MNTTAKVAPPPRIVTRVAKGCVLPVGPTLTGHSMGGEAVIAVAPRVKTTVGAGTIQQLRVAAGENLDGRHAVHAGEERTSSTQGQTYSWIDTFSR